MKPKETAAVTLPDRFRAEPSITLAEAVVSITLSTSSFSTLTGALVEFFLSQLHHSSPHCSITGSFTKEINIMSCSICSLLAGE